MSKKPTISNAEIKKQMEYYLSDANLAKDDFFRGKIESNKTGYIQISLFQNCNKVKKMQITDAQVAEACADSKLIELSDDKLSLRRTGNKPLPVQTGSLRKRDQKAAKKDEGKSNYKEEKKGEEDPEEVPVVRDEHGRI